MKKYLIQIIILAVVMLSFSNCSKYEEGPAFSLATKNARMSREWKVIMQGGKEATDVVIWSFNADESFTRTYNGTLNVNPAIWSFSKKKDMVEIYYITDDFTEYYSIIQLKNSEMILEIDQGTIYRYEFEAVK